MSYRYLDSVVETLDREALAQLQLKKFRRMLAEVLPSNQFYRRKLREAGITRPEDVQTLEDIRYLPFTTKSELVTDQQLHPPYGSNLTYPLDRYSRLHQTSGTTGRPLRWLDTPQCWTWWARSWATVYYAMGVTERDRFFFAFSFGPFIGFWSAHAGAEYIGAMLIPGGGMTSEQRLHTILNTEATVLICTPTYALHLAEVAAQNGLDIASSGVRITIHAGEPGASLPATRQRLEAAWGAKCHDDAGATEIGGWGFTCEAQSGLHINEGEYIFEIIDPVTGESATDGELVITNLGRWGMPVIRYRTGDHVRLANGTCDCGRSFRRCEGGVIGRIDSVLIVRGVNVYPSAIENLIRSVPEIGEFAVDVYRQGELDEMQIRIEVNGNGASVEAAAAAVRKNIRNNLGLRVEVRQVPFGTLPRFELKAKRFTDHRRVEQPSPAVRAV